MASQVVDQYAPGYQEYCVILWYSLCRAEDTVVLFGVVGSNGDRRAPHLQQGNCVKTETRIYNHSSLLTPTLRRVSLNLTYCTNFTDNVTPSRSASTKMAPPTDRKEILAAFRKQIDSGTAIVGAGAGMLEQHQVTQTLEVQTLTVGSQASGSQRNLRKLAVSR
jgi:hypothetical protein